MRIQYSACFAAILTAGAWVGLPANSSAQPAGPTVVVLLQNSAGVPPDLVAVAQAEVVRLYGLIGVRVAWVTTVPTPWKRPRVVSLVAWEPADDAGAASALGITYVNANGRGQRAYVFWRRVERCSQMFRASLYNLLAAAMAHELGHTLIAEGPHTKGGLMEVDWNNVNIRLASAGLLHFSPESAAVIRRGLIDEEERAGVATPARF